MKKLIECFNNINIFILNYKFLIDENDNDMKEINNEINSILNNKN